MPRDAVSRTANVERNGGHKWVNVYGKSFWQFDPVFVSLYLGNYESHHFETKIKGCALF